MWFFVFLREFIHFVHREIFKGKLIKIVSLNSMISIFRKRNIVLSPENRGIVKFLCLL